MLAPNFSPSILKFDELASTNLKMKELVIDGLAEGSVVTALQQTHGKGRGSHLWHSPLGGLYSSVLLYPKESKRATDLALLAGLAVAQAVKQLLPKSVDITVKWPNDTLINFKKVSGVLLEALGERHQYAVIVGMGINININPKELVAFQQRPFGATSFIAETGEGDYEIDQCLSVVLQKLFALYQIYHTQGFGPIQYLWEKNCLFIGKQVELRESGWRPEDGNRAGMTRGSMLGIDETGALVLSNAKGERRQYTTGEITCYWP